MGLWWFNTMHMTVKQKIVYDMLYLPGYGGLKEYYQSYRDTVLIKSHIVQ